MLNKKTTLFLFFLVLICFNNCAPFNAMAPQDNQSLQDDSTSSQFKKTCQLEQISSPFLSYGNTVDFYIKYNSSFERFTYSCNESEWQNLDSLPSSNEPMHVANVPVGSYHCAIKGIIANESIVCSGSLVFEIVANTSSSPTTPSNPSPSPGSAPSSGANSVLSLHQFPVTHTKSSYIDSSGTLVPVKTNPAIGFKNQFAPSGTSGCVMGYPEFRSECETVNGGFGFTLEGVTNYTEFKVYIPAGTTFFGVSGYLPQSVQYAAAVRLGRQPIRTSALSESEYQQAKANQNRNADFTKLLAGEERLMVHDGGGSITLSGIARLSASPLSRGQWLYIRILNGSDIYGLGALYEVNLDIYKSEFNRITFSTSGDPL